MGGDRHRADLALLVDSESPSTDKDHLDRTADLPHDWLPTRLPDVGAGATDDHTGVERGAGPGVGDRPQPGRRFGR
ncbi:hypothetical protein [Streptoalloteichus tenebrarius]|uniref:hypothetical protein n=1 Tax=Streptoalloteichus tenebrarius (strain ATCC 17920 / DSM 40477 / JCM 4838 / CBS 697.72 / NBRC 16177 / NCIMB 11028 / NRRL B-12390 / A12253. 1 / ISP 5477) TaxID=1933 RepID=UPI0020A58E73|nr:hypothetical protein [Streptoalloteichus tenebrarius]BFE99771.1 hypothetical protein GCM10020241_14470 [Streptoalloteichus tenebrarius]